MRVNTFGSVVALQVGVPDPRVGALFVLGYPAKFLEESVPLDGTKPRLFVQGEQDQFGSGEAIRELVEPMAGPRSLVVVPGTDHFFNGRLDELQGAVCTWAEGRPWERISGGSP